MIKASSIAIGIWLGMHICCFGQGDLVELLDISTQNYPELKAKQLERQAAKEMVAYERSDLLPSLTGSYQMVYSTNNNITGMFYPGNVLPISGPPVLENTMEFVYGSAASLLLNWSPFTFGKRANKIQSARLQEEISGFSEELALLEHQIRFVEAYLNFWAAESLVNAAAKNLARYETNLTLSKALVENGLRPGVDSAQFNSLLVQSKIDYLKAQRDAEAHDARVREFLGIYVLEIGIDDRLFEFIPNPVDEPSGVHPLLQASRSQTSYSQVQKTGISRSLLPDLNFWGTTFARGSAIQFDGSFDQPTDGLNFSRYNYGIGFQISMPILEFARTNKLIKRQNNLIAAAEAYEEQVQRSLDKDRTVARVTMQKALEAASLAPVYVKSSTFSFEALQARYDAGLINLSELAQAQADLAKAEAEGIKVQTEMWKALLYYAAVHGDIGYFIEKLN